MAANALLQDQKIRVISTDRQKAGGLEQLRTFMSAMDIDLITLEQPALLKRMVESSASEDVFLLIDTPGTNPFNEEDNDHLKEILEGLDVPRVLVLSAEYDTELSIDMIESFKQHYIDYLLWTKIDVVARAGRTLSATYHSQVPMMAYGGGACVSDLLISATPAAYAQLFSDKYSINRFRQESTT